MEAALGTSVKMTQASETPCWTKLGKSLVSSGNYPAGTVLSHHHINVKVSNPHGIPPQDMDNIVGKMLAKELQEDEPIIQQCISSFNK